MIRRQVVMPVTPERLWSALTDPDQMVGWFGASSNGTSNRDRPPASTVTTAATEPDGWRRCGRGAISGSAGGRMGRVRPTGWRR